MFILPHRPAEENLMETKPEDVLTIEELAVYLKVSKSTLYKIVRQGDIPSQKVGRHWRFRKKAIDNWLERTQTNELHPKGDE